jgi:hypothetical protein
MNYPCSPAKKTQELTITVNFQMVRCRPEFGSWHRATRPARLKHRGQQPTDASYYTSVLSDINLRIMQEMLLGIAVQRVAGSGLALDRMAHE